jgi:hypothetical protein
MSWLAKWLSASQYIYFSLYLFTFFLSLSIFITFLFISFCTSSLFAYLSLPSPPPLYPSFSLSFFFLSVFILSLLVYLFFFSLYPSLILPYFISFYKHLSFLSVYDIFLSFSSEATFVSPCMCAPCICCGVRMETGAVPARYRCVYQQGWTPCDRYCQERPLRKYCWGKSTEKPFQAAPRDRYMVGINSPDSIMQSDASVIPRQVPRCDP